MISTLSVCQARDNHCYRKRTRSPCYTPYHRTGFPPDRQNGLRTCAYSSSQGKQCTVQQSTEHSTHRSKAVSTALSVTNQTFYLSPTVSSERLFVRSPARSPESSMTLQLLSNWLIALFIGTLRDVYTLIGRPDHRFVGCSESQSEYCPLIIEVYILTGHYVGSTT